MKRFLDFFEFIWCLLVLVTLTPVFILWLVFWETPVVVWTFWSALVDAYRIAQEQDCDLFCLETFCVVLRVTKKRLKAEWQQYLPPRENA